MYASSSSSSSSHHRLLLSSSSSYRVLQLCFQWWTVCSSLYMTFSDSLLHSLSLPPYASVPDHASSMALHKHLAPRMLPSQASSPSNSTHGDYFDELWHACAGPLVSVPHPRQLVMYLPQGHIEQISASTNQGSDCQLPKPDLPPHVLCRVVGLQLSAEKDGDEVIAQLSLLPEPEGSDSSGEKDELLPSPKRVVHMFCKTLTASDTSTHGGFSVPRKHAVCLPPLDMTRYPPTQELVAKDLHGQEWRFRHIYRGQPKRHLLTTGWSVFVSQKRLQAGDAVIFLRGESGELRVGIRRAMRQQTTPPSSVLPSQSMHMGVIATVSHAILTRTMFSVYYKPRVSPAEFIIPVERFKKALSCSLNVGMRFKMKFETEDGSERRYTGTITGMNDFDPARWPESKWRSLKVGWDEQTIYERQDRVSPWEIEFSVAPSATPTPGPRNKRFRSNHPTPATDLSVPGRSKAALESMLSANFSTVLQGQELRTLGSSIHSEEANGAPKLHHHQQHLHQHQHHQQQAWGTGSDDGGGGFKRSPEIFWGISGAVGSGQECRGTYALDMAAAAANLSPHHAHMRMHVNQFQQQEQLQQKETGMMDSSSPSVPLSTPSRTSFPCFMNPQYIADGNLKMVAHPLQKQSSNLQPQCVRLDGSSWQSTLHQSAPPVPPNDASHSWLGPLMPSSAHGKVSGVTSSVGLPEKSNNPSQQQWHSHDFPALHSSFASWESKHQEKESAPPTVENSCKIFGFSLTDRTIAASLPPPKPVMSSSVELGVVEPASKQQSLVHDVEHEVEQPPPKIIMPENSTASSDQGKPTANSFKEGQARSQHAVRSCTKVIKKGSMVGRGVDLSKFDNYEQLFEELERMFHMIEGELGNPEKGWQVAYSDNEDDMLLVGDDPWQEFCNMVRKIHILRPEEVQGNRLLDNKTKGCSEEIHASNNSDHSDPQESSVQTVLGERGSVT